MRHFKLNIRSASAAAVCGAALSGCTASRTFVLDSATDQRSHTVASLTRLPSTVDVSPSLATRFEEELSRGLAPEARVAATPSEDLVIGYRFVLFDSGSAAARVGSGVASLVGSPFYGVGDGALGVEVTFSDAAGNTVGHILVEGPISGPFGSPESGVAAAAGSVAKYTKATFLPQVLKAAPTDEYRTPSADRLAASR